jgi:hypothetical protein
MPALTSGGCGRCTGFGQEMPVMTFKKRPSWSNSARALAFGHVGTHFSGAVDICMIEAL